MPRDAGGTVPVGRIAASGTLIGHFNLHSDPKGLSRLQTIALVGGRCRG
jgi:hypothetical protein